jgi:hypothetical protein
VRATARDVPQILKGGMCNLFYVNRVVPKKPTSVEFAPPVEASGGSPLVLVSDKIGDVRAYPATEALAKSVIRFAEHDGTRLPFESALCA